MLTKLDIFLSPLQKKSLTAITTGLVFYSRTFKAGLKKHHLGGLPKAVAYF